MFQAFGSALFIVDVQNDFCAGGALAVPGGDQIIPHVNQAIDRFTEAGVPVYASRDWHPAHTTHFQPFGGRWPVHCVAGTHGAEFHPQLHLPVGAQIVSKGRSGEDDGYSAFEGTVANGTDLAAALRQQHISHLYIAGLATDYCVRATALDAAKQGFQVTVLSDAIAGIDSAQSQRVLRELAQAGAALAQTTQLG